MSTARSQRPLVAIVDDDPDGRELLATILGLKGFAVEQFESAEAALEALPGLAPAIIVTDVTLPDMDGYAFGERVRRSEALRGIPLVALTGRPRDEVDGKGALFADVITKPADPDHVVHALRRLVVAGTNGGHR